MQDFERNIRAVSGGGGLIREGFVEGAAGNINVPDFLCGAAPSPPCKTPNTGRAPISTPSRPTWLSACARRFRRSAPESSRRVARSSRRRAANLPRGAQLDQQHSRFRPASRRRPDQRYPAQQVPLPGGHLRSGSVHRPRQRDPANNAANVQARGILGFNPPSLIAVFNSAPYLHSGAAPTLDAVLENVTHRTVGRADKADTLIDARDRKALVKFLQSIDRTTVPFTAGTVPDGVCGP